MSCQTWLYFLNYLVWFISFLKVKALLPAFCTLTLTNTSSGDIREWCLGSWQVKDKVEKHLNNTCIDEKRSFWGGGKKRNLIQRWWQRSFFTFPPSIYLKFYLAKKKGGDRRTHLDKWSCKPVCQYTWYWFMPAGRRAWLLSVLLLWFPGLGSWMSNNDKNHNNTS